MITRIGVIAQDAASVGFLRGLKQRLGCKAEILEPPAGTSGRTQYLTRRLARQACAYFTDQRVDLIIRLTDADQERAQEVLRKEKLVFPDSVREMVVCAVADRCTEEWLAGDRDFLAKAVGADARDFDDAAHRVGRIKRGLDRLVSVNRSKRDVMEQIVSKAPKETFRRWLDHPTLRSFYQECRRAALRAQCDVPNELGDER